MVTAPGTAPLGTTASGRPPPPVATTVTAIVAAGFETCVVLAITGPSELAWACLAYARVCLPCLS